MATIENFAVLPAKEQREFAVDLLKKINSEKLFSSDIEFEIAGVEPDEFTGGLWIEVSQSVPVEVSRKATWQAADEEDAQSIDSANYGAEYEEPVSDAAKKAFKTLSTVIDGYKVELEISDVIESDIVEVEVDHISHEDAGIGEYEYFGYRGHDSRPYVEVSGTIVEDCECSLAFFVEPDDTPAPVAEEEV